MTLDEALNELGIDRETDADSARRAYLRLLKKRKPEVDREGFMRLREAYEFAKPYFDQIEMFRAIEKAANAEPSDVDGAPQLVRIETPAGIVWVQRNHPAETKTDEPIVQDKPSEEQDKPLIVDEVAPAENVVAAVELPIEQAPPVSDAPVAPEIVTFAYASEQTEVAPVAMVAAESAEPSIDELIAAGKLKKAARRMGQEYRTAIDQGSIDVPAPHQAVLLLLRMHEKNRVDEAKALEKEFAEWLSSTGVSVRIMAGPVSVMWLLVRELGALSKSFPLDLRESISTAIIAGKLDDAQRRAGWFQMRDPDRARNAALDLHAHAPTLATLLGETLAPSESRRVPAPTSSRGGWGIGIVLVMLLNLMRVFVNSPNDTPTSYRGKSDLGEYYRPKPSPASQMPLPSLPPLSSNLPLPYSDETKYDPITPQYQLSDAGPGKDDYEKMDYALSEDLVKLAREIEEQATRARIDNEKLQRAHLVRAFIEVASCYRASPEMNKFVIDARTTSFSSDVKKLDKMLRAACVMKAAPKSPKDGGPAKKP